MLFMSHFGSFLAVVAQAPSHRPTHSIEVTGTNQLLRGEVSESVRRRRCWDIPEWYGVTVDGGIDSDFYK